MGGEYRRSVDGIHSEQYVMSRITNGTCHRSSTSGMSLVELMVAMTVGVFVVIGMIQIFLGSRVAYQVQDGLSRVQENSRFAMSYLERNIRMAGYMGCANDLQRVPPNDPTNANYPYDSRFINHLVANGNMPPAKYRFQRPIEGFEYTGASVAGTAPTVGALTDWTPNLPTELTGKAVKGSDVLILRVFGDQSTPVISDFLNAGAFTVASATFVKAKGVYAIENCGATPTYGFSEIFIPSTSAAGAITAVLDANNVLQVPGAPTLTWNHGIGFSLPTDRPLNASVHEAQYLAIYIGLRDNGDGTKSPALYVQHFTSGGQGATTDDELADNVENLKFQFGLDTSSPRDDTVDVFKTAKDVIDGVAGAEAQDAVWQQVISVRVGMLARSADSNSGEAAPSTYVVAGVSVSPAPDKRVRQVYETTVALRNRIFNS